mmetsp:Transcript_41467/g.65759  ORF Transcript_41467/g.65759 Transcript_41467/m.65759 type:complete len:142 (-) Transcript_41467:146-571(-)|eukprot:CAMPEP_0169113642 /NCGR_PEP_ID=MMETSP1015-20121227/28320_1 /TAXON_ID=342587 /ORGANISM="Karlodinium micrum, Strain CCMP2283" /LENGTH=141 /DNA_ID=CAMNT_0009175845 /DNA_START=40 /DNA_END=465 /DNA_ORIENTATION=-
MRTFSLFACFFLGLRAFAMEEFSTEEETLTLAEADPDIALAEVLLAYGAPLGVQARLPPAIAQRTGGVKMWVVPKKRTSKMKTRSRKANWFAKSHKQAVDAWSNAKLDGYDPLKDPKYQLGDDDDEDDDDDEEEDDEDDEE